jgi:hypothetical protein
VEVDFSFSAQIIDPASDGPTVGMVDRPESDFHTRVGNCRMMGIYGGHSATSQDYMKFHHHHLLLMLLKVMPSWIEGTIQKIVPINNGHICIIYCLLPL